MSSVFAVEGSWVALGPVITFNLTRDGVLLSGSASYSGGQSQDLKGRLSDNRIVMTVTWNPDLSESIMGFSEWTTG